MRAILIGHIEAEMIRTLEGSLMASGLRFAIVVARFNEVVTERLLQGALDGLRRHGAAEAGITVVKVPGSFELPLAAKMVAESAEVHAVIALGALLRGETPHFDVLASQVTGALGQVALASGIPVAFGLLTCDTLEQAMDRAGAKGGNKGFDAALVAIEMASLARDLKTERAPRGRRV
jgi:6,7-dimethyl-8-ribityllumazine synthase